MIIKCRYAKVFFKENRIKSRGEEVGDPRHGAVRIGGEENRRNRKKKVFIIIIFYVFQPQNTKRGRLIAYNIGEVFKRPLILFQVNEIRAKLLAYARS